jgi:spore coat polysaccharide biosynthesis protein SpsF (cytidylyltransferase family)
MTGILVLVRLGSKRLKNKHLITTSKGFFLAVLLKRIEFIFQKEIEQGKVQIVIATSNEPINSDLLNLGYKVYFGEKNNIPLRQLNCAEDLGFDQIISVDGDDILCAPESLKLIYKHLCSQESFVVTKDLPLGMNAMGYTTKFIRESLKGKENQSLVTGWGRIFDQNKALVVQGQCQNFSHHRYTLDYPADEEFFRTIIDNIPNVNFETQKILELTEEKQWFKINNFLSEEYLQNFYKEQQDEI